MKLSAPTVTEALADEIRRAVNALPPAHIIEPQDPRQVGQGKAVELARGLRGEISYKKATRILKNHDLHIKRCEFYHLTRTENLKKLKPDQSWITKIFGCEFKRNITIMT